MYKLLCVSWWSILRTRASDKCMHGPSDKCSHGPSLLAWAGPRASLEVLEKRKSTATAGNRTPNTPVRSLLTILTELSRLVKVWDKYARINILSFMTTPISETT